MGIFKSLLIYSYGMEILIDTSFILSCVKEKVDFTSIKHGRLLLPEQVIKELERIKREGERKEGENASLALQIIEKNKDKFNIFILEKNNVDAGILKYAEGKSNIAVATIDKKLKRQLKGRARILTLRKRKKIELI